MIFEQAHYSYVALDMDTGIGSTGSGRSKVAMLAPRAPRFDLLKPARLRMAAELLRVATIDISAAGAKLRFEAGTDYAIARNQIKRGMLVLLHIHDTIEPQLCTIRWHEGSTIGVKFENVLSVECLEGVIARNTDDPDVYFV